MRRFVVRPTVDLRGPLDRTAMPRDMWTQIVVPLSVHDLVDLETKHGLGGLTDTLRGRDPGYRPRLGERNPVQQILKDIGLRTAQSDVRFAWLESDDVAQINLEVPTGMGLYGDFGGLEVQLMVLPVGFLCWEHIALPGDFADFEFSEFLECMADEGPEFTDLASSFDSLSDIDRMYWRAAYKQAQGHRVYMVGRPTRQMGPFNIVEAGRGEQGKFFSIIE